MSAPSPSIQNKWFLRRVAENNSKSCWICYKPSTSVLITPDTKDFFYICVSHLKDKNFCTPDESEIAALKEKKDKDDLESEKAKIIAEYEEKKRAREKRRQDRKKNQDKDKDKEKDKDQDQDKDKSKERDAKKDEDESKKDDEEKNKKLKEVENKIITSDEGIPRIYALNKSFYNQRLQKMRNAEQAKRTQELLRNPTSFPSVPTGNRSKS